MRRQSVRVSICGVALCLSALVTNSVVAEEAVAFRTPGDVPLCLAPVVRPSSEAQVWVGYGSGRIARLGFAEGRARVAWEAKAEGGILAILELSRSGQTGRDLVASTSTGLVVCFRDDADKPAWRFESTCEVSCLAEFPDADGDGTPEVVAGGADHRVHLLNGKTGKETWGHFFQSREGSGYVTRLLVSPDQNRDGAPDVAVWLWNGELVVLSGRNGSEIWRKRPGEGFTDALAAPRDLDGDGLIDFLVGGNDGTARVCSGRDGATLWSGRVDRPIRDIAAAPSRTGQEAIAYVCTAGGEVAGFDVRRRDGTDKPRWSSNLGDVCRSVVVTADVDRDGTPDAAACAENGVVAILSGKSGRMLRRRQAADTVRAICPVAVGGRPYLAVASLDATVSLLPVTVGDPATGDEKANATNNVPGSTLADKPPVAPRSTTPRSATTRPTPRADAKPGAIPAKTTSAPRVLVLLYHDVVPEEIYHYATSVERFRAQMDALVQEKYTCVSLDQIADWIEGKGGMPERAVCITFDGQYQGQYTYAFPILRERKLFATSYITTDWIGTANHADWHQLREMDTAGVMDVQNHTINHPLLSRCEQPEVIRQLTVCNEAIERHMNGKLARHHTYPSGANNEEVRKIVRDQGFRTATTVRLGPVTRKDDLMGIPRYTVCTHTTLEQFRGWLNGVNVPAVHRAGQKAR